VLKHVYDPAAIGKSYEQAGAAAISVLTEPTFFDGAIAHLEAVRAAVDVPVLRKDFIISEYQLLDAVLLIAAALDARSLAALHAQAARLGLDVVVEVHRADELSIALDAGARIVGVNNRSLRTLTVDVTASERLAARLPSDVLRVSESGLKDASDLARLRGLGYNAFLIGERFMTQDDPGAALHALVSSARVLKGADAIEAPGRSLS
jgi:indole-3-glycerol phosphate synthase